MGARPPPRSRARPSAGPARAASAARAGAARRAPGRTGGLVERAALAGDDDHEPRPARLGMAQKAAQRLMRLGLGQPMQVERAVDRRRVRAPARASAAARSAPAAGRGLGRPRLRRGRGLRRAAAAGAFGRERLRGRRQARAAPPRDAARDLGPERNLLVAEAPQTVTADGASFTAPLRRAEAR